MRKEQFEPKTYYHIYNHSVGNDNLFVTDENYTFFLKRYSYYLNDFIETFSYCLMPNHFHILIKTKDTDQNSDLTITEYSKTISNQFSKFFNSYSQAFNKVNKRKGNLFTSNFNRKKIDSNEYLIKIIHYIHANPVHHGFVRNIFDWKHSSYGSILSNKETHLKRNDILQLFNGISTFIEYHQQPVLLKLEFE